MRFQALVRGLLYAFTSLCTLCAFSLGLRDCMCLCGVCEVDFMHNT